MTIRHREYDITFNPKGLPIDSFDWEAVHEDYDGAPLESGGPPADDRFFLGDSVSDVIGQIEEYAEANQ